ncbi:nitrogenase stabilizing/protective protein NifW [Derxia gummosa]|uniref:Nitrogenase-stabilizing/protective protein NifW n=1 Tax=Derxia gummosa DSM 723 TaxID=1121388 RepID=A0A8B6X1T3_9BURK|nr:nitrogenase stabilizing/protective protein NifW [Derxia gummosa]
MDELTRRLSQMSAAEDFLNFFGVRYDQAVVNVNRLHILKRFYQYLRKAELEGLDEVAMFARYRELLTKAYEDFVGSSAAKEKVFKVFQEADGNQHVSLDSLKSSLPAKRAGSSEGGVPPGAQAVA